MVHRQGIFLHWFFILYFFLDLFIISVCQAFCKHLFTNTLGIRAQEAVATVPNTNIRSSSRGWLRRVSTMFESRSTPNSDVLKRAFSMLTIRTTTALTSGSDTENLNDQQEATENLNPPQQNTQDPSTTNNNNNQHALEDLYSFTIIMTIALGLFAASAAIAIALGTSTVIDEFPHLGNNVLALQLITFLDTCVVILSWLSNYGRSICRNVVLHAMLCMISSIILLVIIGVRRSS